MTRLTIVIIAAALLGAAALSIAHAQPPAQLSPPAEPATGSISGHITIEGLPETPYFEAVHVVSADVPQPISLGLLQTFGVDDQNNFVVTGLRGGDYFLLVGIGREIVEPQSEVVLFPIPEGIGPAGGTLSWPAIRVTVPEGGAVTGLEIIVTRVDTLGGPSTGTGPGGADGATRRIAAGVAVAAALLLACGMALRARGSRRA